MERTDEQNMKLYEAMCDTLGNNVNEKIEWQFKRKLNLSSMEEQIRELGNNPDIDMDQETAEDFICALRWKYVQMMD